MLILLRAWRLCTMHNWTWLTCFLLLLTCHYEYLFIYKLHTLKRISNWPLDKIWYYAIYSINLSQVFWCFFLQCKHQSIGLQNENSCSCTKPWHKPALGTCNSNYCMGGQLEDRCKSSTIFNYIWTRREDPDVQNTYLYIFNLKQRLEET